jgi:hypothetical protein
MRLVAAILAITSLAQAQPAPNNLQPPDPNEIVRHAIETMQRNEYKVHQYTWHRERVFFRLDKNNKRSKETTLTWDVMRKADGNGNEEILVTRDGKPVQSPKPGADAIDTGIKGNIGISGHIGMLPGLFDLTYLREEVFHGRQCWVVLATPSPGAKPKTENDRRLLQNRMTIWITQDGFNDGRWIIEVVGDEYPLAKGSTLEWIDEPNEDGVWLASEMHWRYVAKTRARGEIHDTFTNYRKFDVNSRITVDSQ